MSDEHAQQIRAELKATIGMQGKSRSETDLLAILHSINVLQRTTGLSYNSAVETVAEQQFASSATIRSAVSSYARSGTVTPLPTAHRGRGNLSHPLHTVESLPFEGELLMHRHLNDVRQRDTYESAATLQRALASELSVHTSISTVTRWLHSHGYSFRKKRFMGTLTTAVKNQRMRAYVAAYARALREERAGTAVIVYTDESYVHSQHNKRMAWLPDSSEADAADVRGNERAGTRLIIIHAMTKDGMLEMPDADVSNDLTNVELSCEFVFQSAGVNDDYHTGINSSKWVAWLNNRLIPTFKARYPGKKCTLVLDNARYHHARPHDWTTPSQMSKVQCASFLEHHRVLSISAVRDGVERRFAASTYLQRGRAAPTLVELKAAVSAHLATNPSINTTLPQRAFTKEDWQLLYTPPYVPEVQPIELVWATVKHIVAANNKNNRSVEEARNQTEVAFEQIQADAYLARVVHCQQYISDWMRTDAADQLREYRDLDDLVARLPNSDANSAESQLDIDVDALDVE